MCAVNLGNDADTVGAIYGQIAGAYYGLRAIPEEWRKQCSLSGLIELFAREIHIISQSLTAPAIPVPESTDWASVSVPVPHDNCKLATCICSILS